MRFLAFLPNFLSLSRIALALVFPFLRPDFFLPALLAALATEYLDGALARRFGWESLLGQLLDPIADRFLFLGAGLTLASAGLLSAPALLFLALRDLLVATGFFVILFFRYEGAASLTAFRPNFAGKLTTVLQYAVFLLALTRPAYAGGLIAVTGILGIVSALSYALRIRTFPSFGRDA